MAAQPGPSMEAFDAYFTRADLDRDGRISGAEAVAFFQGSNLPKAVLAQIWMHADQKRTGYLGRQEFYNALRLVTVAQSGRELTQEMVNAALYGPAAARIPAPRINPVSTTVAQMNPGTTSVAQSTSTMPAANQMSAMGPPAENSSFRGHQVLPNAGASHFMRPQQSTPTVSATPQGFGQGIPGGVGAAGPRPAQGFGQTIPAGVSGPGTRPPSSNTSNLSTDWLRTGTPSGGVPSQVPNRGATPSASHDGFGLGQFGTTSGVATRPPKPSIPASSIPLKQSSSQPAAIDPKAMALSGNGFSSVSGFGASAFSATPQAKQDVSPIFAENNMPNPSIASVGGSQDSTKPGQLDPLQNMSLTGSQIQGTQSLGRHNQLDTAHSSLALSVPNVTVGPATSASSQAQLPWPAITQSDIRKYTAVFVEVDKDRDGKITGQEARNLFLSWRLPREVLKQVWDLSDQDNDSMLSLREFCTALYLMERYREGRPLPAVLPDSLRPDGPLLPAISQNSAAYAAPAWQPRPGLPQQGMPQPHHVMPVTGAKPPMPPSPSQTDEPVQPAPPKSKVPVLEKHLVNQLSKEEQSALNSKFQEAEDAEKKVQELEKEILDAREKTEFYRTKMQELVLYKSKCDNRLNEIMERTSADKREVEILARKYEAKYKESGDVASKLTLEQATFRDIQEKSLELYASIAKMEQGGSADGSLQARVDQIQSELEKLMKDLNERCKDYGLRAKPTSLVELPFGWQPGIQGGAADWEEDWDKFEEGFTVIKELTIEEEIAVTAAKPKPHLVQMDIKSADASISSVDSKSENSSKILPSSDVDGMTEKSPAVASSSDGNSKTDSTSAVVSSSTVDSKIDKPSSVAEQIESEPADADSEDGSARSPTESPRRVALDNSSHEFHSSELGMHAASPHTEEGHSDHGAAESSISAEKFDDEPSWGATFDAGDDADSVWGFSTGKERTDQERNEENFFFGSGDFGLNPIRTYSPSAVSTTERKGPFFDSVPGTPLYNVGSSPRFNDGPEDRSFDNFSRFESFRMNDSGPFPQHDTFTRFDSVRGETLTRFDSIRSTTDHGHGFSSFDDSDPFGSSGPFKSSESHTPKKGTDSWSAF